MKYIFRLIGFLVVVIILVAAVLFYLDGKGLLSGELGNLVHSLRILGAEAWRLILSFAQDAGIAEDAASLLDQGADLLRGTVAPHATSRPGADALTTPTPYLPPTFTPTPSPTFTPPPTPTPYSVYFSVPG